MLTKKQKVVLANTLAWYAGDPSSSEIEALFAYTDKGVPVAKDYTTILTAWNCHYANPFTQVEAAVSGSKNPPISPPAAWIWNALYSDFWEGWLAILTDFMRDSMLSSEMRDYGEPLSTRRAQEKWLRFRPAYEKAYRIAAYLHGRLDKP